MNEKLTVSDSKTLFHEQFPFVIPSLYKRIVDEMLVELNLLNHQSDFSLDSYFCVGLTETFKELTKDYEPHDHREELFNALCKSTNFVANDIKTNSEKTIKDHENKSSKDILDQILKNSPSNLHYSRILILGIYKIFSLANDFKDEEDIKKLNVLVEISEKLNLPLTRCEKDISIYKSSIKKFEQAKELLKETVKADREKREGKK